MLTHLKLENFKIWRSTGPTRLAPITLLLGTNRHSAPDLGINLPIALTQYLQNDLLVSC